MTLWRFAPLALLAAPLLEAAEPFVIANVRIFDGTRMLPPANVRIADGHIRAIGRGVRAAHGDRVIDGTGKTLLPGLIDAHMHTLSRDTLVSALRFGVTTCLDMFTSVALASTLRAEQAARDICDLRSAGTLVTAPGGHGTEYGVPIPTLARAEDAAAFVDARIAEGSDYIKLVKDDGSAFGFHRPTLDQPTLTAAVSAAHARGKLAVVHIATLADAREALAARADGLAHVYAGEPDAAVARTAAERHVFWTPTLSVTGVGFEAVSQMRSAGVAILAGTDAPNAGLVEGESLHGELALLVQAGLSPLEALAAATSRAAGAFHLMDRGRIAVGLRADLVLVDGDPSQDIRATRAILGVWKLGDRVK